VKRSPFVGSCLALAVTLIPSVQRLTAAVSSLPADSQADLSAALGREIPGYHARPVTDGFDAANSRQRLAAHFTSTGVRLQIGTTRWQMTLQGYGYGGTVSKALPTAPAARLNRVEYRRGALTEWYVNGPVGLEQGFTIAEPVGRSNGWPLTIALGLSGPVNATVDADGEGLTLTESEGERLRYAGLTASDAQGRRLRTWIEARQGQLLVRVKDSGASYPVVIDPFLQLAKLTAPDGAADDDFGWSVSISGNTVVVGEPYATIGANQSQGAAYVFVKPASGWANMTQVAKLTASDGFAYTYFGYSVSVNGNTVVAGAQGALGGNGAAYVFVKPASGWTDMTQTAELTASDGIIGDYLGAAVSVSRNTVVAGAASKNSGQGAVYVFVKPAHGWANMTQQAELTASDGMPSDSFGFSVAASGNTVVAGSPKGITGGIGSAYVFVKPSGGWADMTQTAELTASDGSPDQLLGTSVSVSGNAVVAGASNTGLGGTAYVFVEPVGGWADMTQTAELTARRGAPPNGLGASVSISGNTIVAGAPFETVGSNSQQGVAYLFKKPASGWTNMTQTAKLTAADGAPNDNFGHAISVSGGIVAVGAPQAAIGGNDQQGAAYVFAK
jgi:hypothetical protein